MHIVGGGAREFDCEFCTLCGLSEARGCTGGDVPQPLGRVEAPWHETGWADTMWGRINQPFAYRRDIKADPMWRCPRLLVDAAGVEWVHLGDDATHGHAVDRERWPAPYRDAVRAIRVESTRHEAAMAHVTGLQ